MEGSEDALAVASAVPAQSRALPLLGETSHLSEHSPPAAQQQQQRQKEEEEPAPSAPAWNPAAASRGGRMDFSQAALLMSAHLAALAAPSLAPPQEDAGPPSGDGRGPEEAAAASESRPRGEGSSLCGEASM
jgi:hypothetical protein